MQQNSLQKTKKKYLTNAPGFGILLKLSLRGRLKTEKFGLEPIEVLKKNLKKVVLVLALLLPGVIKAQEFNVTAKADFVSDYIWRGAYQNSGFSVQPTLGLSYGNLSLSAWGSQSLTKTDGAQEFDINLSYTIGGLGITVTDYWWNGITMPYGDYKHDHHFEGTLAYNFGENFPLTLSWSTMFAGGDDNKDGDRAYSTYINASYNIACPAEITLTPSVGFTPWKGMYDADGAAFTDIALKASKNINITDHFSLPLFVQAIVSPSFDKTYLIAGLSIGF